MLIWNDRQFLRKLQFIRLLKNDYPMAFVARVVPIRRRGEELVVVKIIPKQTKSRCNTVPIPLGLDHSNLAGFLGYINTPNNDTWVVWEYVHGVSLSQVLDQGVSLEGIRWIAYNVARALHHLHSIQLCHG